MPRIHEIKCLPRYFEEVAAGRKGFEIRRNDRDYKVGDLLAMNEFADQQYTGRALLLKVDYMMDPNDVMTCGQGYVVMGVHPIPIWDDFVGHGLAAVLTDEVKGDDVVS